MVLLLCCACACASISRRINESESFPDGFFVVFILVSEIGDVGRFRWIQMVHCLLSMIIKYENE